MTAYSHSSLTRYHRPTDPRPHSLSRAILIPQKEMPPPRNSARPARSQPHQTGTRKSHHCRSHQLALCTTPRLLDSGDNSFVLLTGPQQFGLAVVGVAELKVSTLQLREAFEAHLDSTLQEQWQRARRIFPSE